MILRSLLRRNGASDSMMTGSSSTNDYGDKQAFLGKEDLATFGVINTFVISIFVCAVRFLHRRRRRAYMLHDTLLLISLFLGLLSTIASVISLQVCTGLHNVTPGALKSWLAAVIIFDLALGMVRLSVLAFAFQHFLSKIRLRRYARMFKATIYVLVSMVLMQVIIAIVSTLFSCRPVSAAWDPIHFSAKCRYLSRLQLIHSICELLIDASIMLLLTGLYYKLGMEKSRIPFRLAILAVGLLALGTMAGRTSCLSNMFGALPPIYEIYPLVLMAISLNSDLTATALLIICTSIHKKQSRRAVDTRTPSPNALEMEIGFSLRSKGRQSTWEEIPDLTFQSSTTSSKPPRALNRSYEGDQYVDLEEFLPTTRSPPLAMIGLGIRRSLGWLTPRSSRVNSPQVAQRTSKESIEIWGIKEALAATKELPPLPKV